MMRNSERGTLKRCPQRWWWSYVEGLKPNKTNTKLWMGTGVHIALAEWYQLGKKRGPHPVETWNEYVDHSERQDRTSAVWNDDEVAWHDAREMGEYMLTSYVEHYGKDTGWHVIATERTFKQVLAKIVTLVGTFDGVYRDLATGELWLMEHKTAAAFSFTHLPLDPQGATYHAIATSVLRNQGLIGPKDEIVGVMYNFLLKYNKPDDTRPKNAKGEYCNKPTKVHFEEAFAKKGIHLPKIPLAKMQEVADEQGLIVLGDVSKVQPKSLEQRFHREPLFKSKADRLSTLNHIKNDAIVRDKYAAGELPLLKNPTKDCSWDCDFYQLCQMHEAGGDWEDYKKMAYHVEDLFEDHRKSA